MINPTQVVVVHGEAIHARGRTARCVLAVLWLAGLITLAAPALAGAHSSQSRPRSAASSRHKRHRRHATSARQHARHGTHAARSRRDVRERPSPSTSGTHSDPTASTGAPRPQPAVCSGATLTPTPENLEAVREATMCLINDERITFGERPLQPNADLQNSAQGQSESMANDNYFSHEGPDGSTPLSRMEAAGYIYSPNIGYEIGENIAWGTLWLATPKSIVESWMQSPEHRANILDDNYTETGIGVDPHAPATRAEGQAGALYTQDFGVIIPG